MTEQVNRLSPARTFRVMVGAGIADGPVQRVGIRIVAAGEPRRAAAVLPAVAFPGIVAEFAWQRESC